MPLRRDDNEQPSRDLVFVHGSGDSARCWDPLLAQLPHAQWRAVALDLPGHGTRIHDPLPSPPTVAAYAEAVRQDMAARGLSHATLIGHSLGGAITLRLALDAPALVARIALVGSGARLRTLPALLDSARTDPGAAARAIVTLGFAGTHQDMAETYVSSQEPVAPEALYHDLSACDTFDIMDELQRVAQPALVIVGTADQLTPPKYAAYLAAHLPHARLVEIPDSGHYVMCEAPEATASALMAWME